MFATAASASPSSHSVDSNTPLEMVLLGISCVMLTYRKQLAEPPETKNASPVAKE